MPDMLVKLYSLPAVEPLLETLRSKAITIRRPMPHEISRVGAFVQAHFSKSWADEISVGYANKPITVFIAIREGEVVGFAGYECTARAFFGPTGVDPALRGSGIGTALLLASLHGLREMGYAYGIIGAAGPVEFYAKAIGAIPIPDSVPGIYRDPLKKH